MSPMHRREFLQSSAALSAAACLSFPLAGFSAAADKAEQAGKADQKGSNIQFGLVTYQWAKDWDLPTLIANCTECDVLGVELRTTHKHGVEPALSEAERREVRKRFEDSPVTLVGLGSNERFDDPDPKAVRKAIDASKAFIELSHDLGSSGVKVKPDRFWPDVPREQTIEQIGKSLNELGEFAEGFGQQVRLEVHGQCSELPTIAAILKVANHPSVAACWNSNPTDLKGDGLEHNFNLVKDRLGATSHVHVFDMPDYPFAKLFDLFVAADYHGWWLLEEGKTPADPVSELKRQKKLFTKMLAESQQRVG